MQTANGPPGGTDCAGLLGQVGEESLSQWGPRAVLCPWEKVGVLQLHIFTNECLNWITVHVKADHGLVKSQKGLVKSQESEAPYRWLTSWQTVLSGSVSDSFLRLKCCTADGRMMALHRGTFTTSSRTFCSQFGQSVQIVDMSGVVPTIRIFLCSCCRTSCSTVWCCCISIYPKYFKISQNGQLGNQQSTLVAKYPNYSSQIHHVSKLYGEKSHASTYDCYQFQSNLPKYSISGTCPIMWYS